MNPTMKAINAKYKKMREEFIKTSIRTPREKFSDDGLTSTRGFGLTVDELYEGAPRYTGKLQKVGDQTPILEYIKQRENDKKIKMKNLKK